MTSSTSPHPGRRPGALRAGAATGSLGLAALTLAGAAVDAVARASAPGAGPDAWVAAAAIAVGLVAVAVLGLGCALLLAAALTRSAARTSRWLEATASHLTPAVLRRALAVTVGTGLSLGAGVGAATAQEVDLGWEPTASQATLTAEGDETVEGSGERAALEQPHSAHGPEAVPEALGPDALARASHADAATVSLAEPAQGAVSVTAEAQTAAPGSAEAANVTVARGDTLWDIAQAHLGPGATAEQVAQAWPAWHEENREVIGADPHLIRAGQVLAVPTTGPGADDATSPTPDTTR
ncbi:LysM peptidoglycan-binding domain-containing protein [Actinotalea sp. BY-33]|uniref:LysM peptidoglycan-binding domain-containing protein n=1 Tax=Actinotalea soli TaxID=2819234 RepID=A0A939LNB8_9CELL|nr:LysM peptidoglycan-binding domain-containing protein [Actinotalea soli]MBO1750901.1 LysM peptidoglycan-binding domain-containing protein [Actinotalea soli]